MNKIQIGVIGGTFDPIHNGHLLLAENARKAFNLDKIIFMPAGIPPHKRDKHVSSNTHRYNMTLLAINSNKHFFFVRYGTKKRRSKLHYRHH